MKLPHQTSATERQHFHWSFQINNLIYFSAQRPAKTDLTSRSRSLCRHSFSHKFECHRFQRDPPCTTYTLEVYKKHQNIGMHSRNRLVHRLCRECFTGTPFSSATRHFLCRAAKEVSAAVWVTRKDAVGKYNNRHTHTQLWSVCRISRPLGLGRDREKTPALRGKT